MHTVVAKEFAHRASGIRGDVLQRRGLGRSRRHDDGVFERAVILQCLDDLGDGRAFLADRDVNAIELDLFVGAAAVLLLVEDGVHRGCGLAGLTIADDQLALPAPDRHQRVDGLEPGLHRLMHRTARHDPGRLDVHARPGNVGQRALAVDRFAERIDDAPEEAASDRHIDDCVGAFDGVAFADVAVVAKHDDPDIVAFEIEGQALLAIRKLDQLARLNLVEAVDAGDAVADRQYLTDLRDVRLGAEIGDLLFEDRRNLRRANFHKNPFRIRPGTTPEVPSPPRKRGSRACPWLEQGAGGARASRFWIPAFAGMTN